MTNLQSPPAGRLLAAVVAVLLCACGPAPDSNLQIRNLVATQGTGIEVVSLSWDSNSGATEGYGVFRADAELGPWTALGNTFANEYHDETADPDRHYWYSVEGYSIGGGVIERSAPAEGW